MLIKRLNIGGGVYPTRIDLKNPSGGISVYGYISIEIEK